ncbi:Rv2993c-like domain-containing protein, partial [Streptomyces sp. NPDC059900]
MKIARVRYEGRVLAARVDGDTVFPVVAEDQRHMSDAVRDLIADGTAHDVLSADVPGVPLADVELLSPLVAPQKIICIGLN